MEIITTSLVFFVGYVTGGVFMYLAIKDKIGYKKK